MNDQIERKSSQEIATVANGAAISGAIDYRGFAMGGLITPAALTATTVIAFKVASNPNGTFTPLYNASNALVEVTVTVDASKAYPLPDELSGWPYFKLWTEASAADVNQAAARTFEIVMKG